MEKKRENAVKSAMTNATHLHSIMIAAKKGHIWKTFGLEEFNPNISEGGVGYSGDLILNRVGEACAY